MDIETIKDNQLAVSMTSDICVRLRRMRKSRKFSQRDFAMHCGVSMDSISKVEKLGIKWLFMQGHMNDQISHYLKGCNYTPEQLMDPNFVIDWMESDNDKLLKEFNKLSPINKLHVFDIIKIFNR